MANERDFLQTEEDTKGLTFTSLKQTILQPLRNTRWSGCMMHCYLYLSFHVNVRTGVTRDIPIAELVDETDFSRRQVYNALKALKDCDAIIEVSGKSHQYRLPDIATTSERRASVKTKAAKPDKPKASKPKQPQPKEPHPFDEVVQEWNADPKAARTAPTFGQPSTNGEASNGTKDSRAFFKGLKESLAGKENVD